jgi:hypothetical protein
VDADEPQRGGGEPVAVDGSGVLQRDAELVGLQAGGDVRMALRVDVRVHAERHARLPPERACDLGDAIELSGRLGVDRADVGADRVFKLRAGLADAGEDDIARRESGAERDVDLAAGVRIGAAAERAEQARDRQRRVCLQRVMDRMRIAVERRIDGAIRLADRPRAVDIRGSADTLDDGVHADAIADEAACSRLER